MELLDRLDHSSEIRSIAILNMSSDRLIEKIRIMILLLRSFLDDELTMFIEKKYMHHFYVSLWW